MEKSEHPYTVGRYAQWCSCYENSMEVSPETKTRVAIESAIPLLGIYPDKTLIQKDTCTLVFIATLFTIAKTWKQAKCPSTDE